MVISFVIPVYNTARYLEKCVDSILSQGIDEDVFEIIIINDGSTDESADVIKRLAESNRRIRAIHQQNLGLSIARNVGIGLAQGDYIFFVDSDDYLFPGTLPQLVRYAENNPLDIIGFDYAFVYDNRQMAEKKRKPEMYNKLMPGAEYLCKYNLSGGVWYLFARTLLQETPVLMPEGIYHEDEVFLPKVFTYAQRVTFINLTVYAYYQRSGSITNNAALFERRITDYFSVLDNLILFLKETALNQLQRQSLEKKLNFLAVDIIINLIQAQAEKKFILSTLQKLNDRNLYPLAKASYSGKYKLFRFVFNSKNNILRAARMGLIKKK
ncbi:glycosyltransferase involved in cell wall biosynthesis [Dysgonomonas sp. PH5-45]|uniref:glycosyltransferase family 2 protein n=1 Tax=unclassified Dysgonomonas TaxID=2630389 RepID=UPI00247647D7|nr:MULTISPECIES: glycosyltransferase [unclassified Dysgonomonas]MDH6353721.1 glycosyltransferase involved in cell wall biosynthesis [Dysgonomonas sp. PH5-45]MDH6386624.1 glycosyltransferase involved in cell wall biosynthesis [Dysgonomonas sp. PH5-37]